MRLLKVTSVIFLALLLIGIVSADNNVDYFNNTTQITFEGVDLVIPEGFGELKDTEDFDDL